MAVPLDTHLIARTRQAYTELRAALMLVLPHDNFCGFIMAGDAPRYLATVMLPHSFWPANMDCLVTQANQFIRKMRKDTPFWKDFDLFKPEQLNNLCPDQDPQFDHFLGLLRSLPFGSRCHFFDLIDEYAESRAGRKPIEQLTSYPTRKRGIDAHESAKRLSKSGLIDPSHNPRAFLLGKTTKELHRLLYDAGVEFSKSWKKEKLVSTAMDKCPGSVAKMCEEVVIGRIPQHYTELARRAIEHINRTIPFFQVWAAFGVESS
jgi:hypothetical protein